MMSLALLSLVCLSMPAHPAVYTETFEQGHSLILVERPSLPLSFVEVDFPIGYSRDAQTASGLAAVVGETIRLELAARFFDLEVDLSPTSLSLSFNRLHTRVSTGTKNLLNDVKAIAKSASLQKSFAYAQANVLQRRRQVATVSTQLLEEGIEYSLASQAGREPRSWGRLKSIQDLKFEQVRSRLQQLSHTDRINIVVVGRDVHPLARRLKQLVNTFYEPGENRDLVSDGAAPQRTPTPGRQILVIDRPGQSRSLVSIFQPIFSQDHAQVHKMAIGGLSHGLFAQQITELGGKIKTSSNRKLTGQSLVLDVRFECETAKLGPLLSAIETLWEKTAKVGLPNADTRSAQAQIEGLFRYEEMSGARLARAMRRAHRFGLPTDRLFAADKTPGRFATDSIDLSLHQTLRFDRTQIVILTDVSGKLVQTLTKLWPSDRVEVLTFDALL
jgi:predicted Zn-dependent peptidase